MLSADPTTLAARCHTLVARLAAIGLAAEVASGAAVPGGGAAPDTFLEGPVVQVDVVRPNAFAARLRASDPPIIVRVTDDRLVIDLRTVAEDDDDLLAARVTQHAS